MKRLAACALVVTLGLIVWMSVERQGFIHATGAHAATEVAPRLDEQPPSAADETALELLARPPLGSVGAAARIDAARAEVAEVWSIRGRAVTAGDRRPVAGLGIQLALHAGYAVGAAPYDSASVTTEDDGAFTWSIEPPQGTVTLEVVPDSREGFRSFCYGSKVMVRGDGPLAPLEVLVMPLDVEVRGHVRDEDGRPLDGCRVKGHTAETVTDAAGAYQLAMSSAGRRDIAVSRAGFREGRTEFARLAAGDASVVDFVLHPGAVLEGRVLDGSDSPIEGALVRVFGSSGTESRTAADGCYRFDTLDQPSDGQCVISVHATGYANLLETQHLDADAREHQHDFVLVPGATVSGRVLNSEGRPVPGAEVWAGESPQWGDPHARVDDEGRFELSGLAASTTALLARKSSYGDGLTPIAIVEGNHVGGVVVSLTSTRAVRGTVRDPAGQALAGVLVAARGSHDQYVGETMRTDVEGRFEIPGLPEEPLRLETFAIGLQREWIEVASTVNDVEITVHRAGRLHGRVVDAETGAPVETFTVRVGWPGDASLAPRMRNIGSAWMDPGKSFDTTDGAWSTAQRDTFVPGEWARVEVRAPGYAPRVLPAVQVLSAEDTEGFVHELPRPVALEVAIVSAADGAPLRGARLSVTARVPWQDGDLRWDAETGEAGLAVLDGVTPGPLYFRVTRGATGEPLTLGPFEVAPGSRRAPLTVEVPAGAMPGVVPHK